MSTLSKRCERRGALSASKRAALSVPKRRSVAFVDQGDTGEQPAADAHAHGVRLEGINRSDANRDFVLLPHRWVGERGVT